MFRRVGLGLALAGLDPRPMVRSLAATPRFLRQFREYRDLARAAGQDVPRFRDVIPALADATDEAGSASSEYFLADLWVARRVASIRPGRHLDIGSRIDGLVAHLLTVIDVDVVDIRPLRSEVSGLRFVQSDATSLLDLPQYPSVSSVHALEHFGLGRYGDAIDPDGHRRGLEAIGRVVEPDGDLYIGLPVGRSRVEFNAHRVVDPELVPEVLSEFTVVEFAAVLNRKLIESTSPEQMRGTEYAVGLYHLRHT